MTDIKIDEIIHKIESNILPTFEDIVYLTDIASENFAQMPNVVKLKSPITICGDIHGQFSDLMELFKIGGRLPFTDYVFLGDYVDRGKKSVETVSYLFALKLKYPNHITLLRGNHESQGVSQHFGFRDECILRYGNDAVWETFNIVFNQLPLAALIDDQILCIHGGLSPQLKKISDIENLNRFQEIPTSGPMCDLVWSDPTPKNGFEPSMRDAGYQFGPDITKAWNEANGLKFTARAHQMVMDGLEFQHNKQLVTIFSAPNYCLRCKNAAGILELDEKLRKKAIRFFTPRKYEEENQEIPDYFSIDLSD